MTLYKDRTGTIISATLLIEVVIIGLSLTLWWMILRNTPAFRFARPDILFALSIGPLLVLLFLVELWRRRRSLTRYSSPTMIPALVPTLSAGAVFLRFLAFRHGLSFVILALAGPQFGTRVEEVKARGVDVVVALDVSNSMTC
ncbi:MAG: hypothetical protein KDC02_25875, partial [Flavobacteriales bacterium]|nr:hypothetical protein [Flavobacteriales bacterium]